MIWLAWISLMVLGFGTICCVLGSSLDVGGLFVLGFVVPLVTWLVCGVVTLVVLPSRTVGRISCRNWAAQTGIQTKFVILNWSDTGICLAKTPSGNWIPNDQWAAFVRGSK